MTSANRSSRASFAPLPAGPDDLPDSLGNVGMDPAQTRALAVIRAASIAKTPVPDRDGPGAGRPLPAPAPLDPHAAELLQLRAEVEATKTGLTRQFAVGSLTIVVVIAALIVLNAR